MDPGSAGVTTEGPEVRKWLGQLSLVFWLGGLGFAEEPVLVRFHTDPPEGVQVVLRASGVGNFDNAGKAKHVLGSAGEFVSMPSGLGEYEIILEAEGYAPANVTIHKFDLGLGANEWPKDGQPIVLVAQAPRAVLGQLIRLHPFLTSGLGLLIVGLSGYWFFRQSLNWNQGKRAKRIEELGGDPTDKPIGPFIPIGELGAGGYGQVVKAVHQDKLFRSKPEMVAVKTLLAVGLDDQVDANGAYTQASTQKHLESRRQRFTREAQTLERLEHPNIVRLVHYSLQPPKPYLVMEFVPGKNFRQLLGERSRPYTPAEALALILPVCRAMQYAHSQNPPIIHRDIKPENLMLSESGEVKVMDLGLAHSLGDSRLTATAEWTGTAQYAPVEYFQGVVSPALDQFSIGLVLHELITAEAANPQSNPSQAAEFSIMGYITRLEQVRPDLGEFAQVVDRMCHQDYSKRYNSLDEAAAELQRTCPR